MKASKNNISSSQEQIPPFKVCGKHNIEWKMMYFPKSSLCHYFGNLSASPLDYIASRNEIDYKHTEITFCTIHMDVNSLRNISEIIKSKYKPL
jgi:hypothetical protein